MIKDEYYSYELSNDQLKRPIGLKDMAYKDYVAARLLLMKGLLHQAAFFINTAIEKQLKAFLVSFDSKKKPRHNIVELYNLAREKNKNAVAGLNLDFLSAVNEIYKSRYYEQLNPGYNFVIIKRKFLAELDFTFDRLEPTVVFSNRNGGDRLKTKYEKSVSTKDQSVFCDNYVLNKMLKHEFLNSEDIVYEFRVMPDHSVAEFTYRIESNTQHNKFNYEAMKPDGHGWYRPSHKPVPSTPSNAPSIIGLT